MFYADKNKYRRAVDYMSVNNKFYESVIVLNRTLQGLDNIRSVLLDLKYDHDDRISEKADYIDHILGLAFSCDNKEHLRHKLIEVFTDE